MEIFMLLGNLDIFSIVCLEFDISLFAHVCYFLMFYDLMYDLLSFAFVCM